MKSAETSCWEIERKQPNVLQGLLLAALPSFLYANNSRVFSWIFAKKLSERLKICEERLKMSKNSPFFSDRFQ
jgi:hypothetical protein